MRVSWRWRVASLLAAGAVVAFVARAVIRNWEDVRSAELAWDLSPLHLLGGVLVTWTIFALLAEAWRRLVAAWGFPLAWWPASRVWLLSSMAKYVPGKIWAFAGMALMAKRLGVPAWASTGSSVLLQTLSLGTGALVVSTAGVGVLEPAGIGRLTLLSLAAGSVALTALAVWPPLASRVLARLAPETASGRLPGAGVLAWGAAANLVAWLGYGLAFALFARGTLPDLDLGLGEAIGAFTAAYIAGVLVPLPGGLGVREGILVLILRDRTGLAAALALAAVVRLGVTAAEVGASIPFLARQGEQG